MLKSEIRRTLTSSRNVLNIMDKPLLVMDKLTIISTHRRMVGVGGGCSSPSTVMVAISLCMSGEKCG